MDEQWKQIMGKLRHMQENGLLCDCNIMAKDFESTQITYTAHSALLAAQSEFFYDFLVKQKIEVVKHVQIYALSYKCIEIGLNFIYGKYPKNDEELVLLKHCADHLKISSASDYVLYHQGFGNTSASSSPAHITKAGDNQDDDYYCIFMDENTETDESKKVAVTPEEEVVSEIELEMDCVSTDEVEKEDYDSAADVEPTEVHCADPIVLKYEDDGEYPTLTDTVKKNPENVQVTQGHNAESKNVQAEEMYEDSFELDNMLLMTKTCIKREQPVEYVLEGADDEQFMDYIIENNGNIEGDQFPCPVCVMMCPSLDKLRVHISRHHLCKQPILKCPLCGLEEIAQDKVEYQRRKMSFHIVSHYEVDPTTSDKIIQKAKAGLLKVAPAAHDKPVCELCHHVLKTKENLKQHRKICSNNVANMLRCKVCMLTLSSLHSLIHHMKEHLKRRFYICSICGKSSLNENKMCTHFKVDHSLDATYAHLKYIQAVITPLNINEYIQIIADAESAVSLIKDVFPCLCCKSVFTTSEELVQNIADHIIATEAEVRPLQIYLYECHLCGEMSRSNKANTTHILDVHEGGENQTVYTCEHCPTKFLKKEYLRSHMLTHSNILKYVCEVCGKSFRFVQGIKRHRKLMHDPESMTLYCDFCDFSTTKKNIMMSHENRHKEYKPYQCDLCEKSYHGRQDLARHQVLKHKGSTYSSIKM